MPHAVVRRSSYLRRLIFMANWAGGGGDELQIQTVWTRVAGGLIVQMWRLPDWQEGKCCQSAVAAARHEEEADGTR